MSLAPEYTLRPFPTCSDGAEFTGPAGCSELEMYSLLSLGPASVGTQPLERPMATTDLASVSVHALSELLRSSRFGQGHLFLRVPQAFESLLNV